MTFAKPGFFLTDIRVVLLLDGAPVYDGGFLAGIDVMAEAAPGPHRLESVIDLGFVKRRQSWDVVAPAAVVIEYSRLWGNFKKRAHVRP